MHQLALGTHVPALWWYHCWYVSLNWWLNEPFIFQGTSFKKWFYLFLIWVSNNSFYVTFWHGSSRIGVAPYLSQCFSFTVFKLWNSMRFKLCRNVILNYFFLLMNCFFEDGDKEPVQVCGINVVVINVFFFNVFA